MLPARLSTPPQSDTVWSLMRRLAAFCLLAAALSGCFGEPAEKEPPKSIVEQRSLDPVSTPIYAGEDAKAKIGKAAISKAIQGFQEAEGRNPASLQELVDKQYLPSLPREPVGYRFEYDPQTGAFDTVLK
jgi:hypothetical protein